MSSLYHLLHRAVDYAGLFPPAALPMSQVVDNYAKYLTCNKTSMLGRLIIPASKLSDFESAASQHFAKPNDLPWRISALVPSIESEDDSKLFDEAFQAIDAFNGRHAITDGVQTVVDAVEVKTPNHGILEATIDRLGKRQDDAMKAFLEIPHSFDPTPLIETIAKQAVARPVFAKIRTGGVTPDWIPPANEIARFIHACVVNDVGFKATAGLHHPIRSKHPLTYESDAPSALMHGFLNVFVAAAIGFEHQPDVKTLEEILMVDSTREFSFAGDRLSWKTYDVAINSIVDTRNHGLISFGSCSFVEPTEELIQLPDMTHTAIFTASL